MGAYTSCAGPGLFTQRPAIYFWTTKCSGNGLFKPFPALMSLWDPSNRSTLLGVSQARTATPGHCALRLPSY